MALFTDEDFVSLADMLAIDPEVSDVADAESIVVEGDGGVIRQAWDECANVLLDKMQAFGGAIEGGRNSAQVFLTQIVASDVYARKQSALQRWLLYSALMLFYRAAGNRVSNDRYAEKHGQYSEDIKRHWKVLWRRGLPIVLEPLPCPGSLHERNAGTWDQAAVSAVAGGSATLATYEVAVTYVDGSRYATPASKGNAESGPSRILAYTVPANYLLRVDISGLVAPDGTAYQRTPADGAFGLLKATGWNIYAGLPGQPLYLQNASPVAIGTKVHTLAGAPMLSGYALDPGQVPDANFTFYNLIERA